MKNFKKTLSLLLATSMISSSAISISHAEEKTTDSIIKTVDLSGMYNRSNVYVSALSKVKYNDDGSVMTNAEGVIQQTGAGGSAGYSGAFYYDYFIQNQDTYTWKTPWIEDMTINTLTTKSGTEFELKVFDGSADNTVNVAWSNNEGLSNVTKDEQFTTFDIEDGYYSALKLLANTNYSGAKSSMLIKLNYADGTSETALKGLNYFANGANNDVDKDAEDKGLAITNKRIRGIRNEELAAGITELTPEMLDQYAYIGEYSVAVDNDKKLVSFGVLNANYYLTTDAETGEYILDDNGAYVIAEYEKKSDGKYVVSTNERLHSTLLYAATLLTTESLELKNLKDSIETKINDLSDELSYDDIEEYEAINKMIDEYLSLGGTTADFESYPVFTEKYDAVKMLEPAEINVDLTPYLNRDGVYSSDESWGGSSAAGNPGNFDYTAFVSDKYITWVTPWTAGMTDNKLISDGHTFKLKVVDAGNGVNTTNVIFWNGGNNTSADWTNIDVHDGRYNSVEVLANTNRTTAGITHTLVVRLNYEDGSEIIGTNGEYELNYFTNNPGGTVIQSKRFKNVNPGTIRHLSIPAEYGRTLKSIDILNAHQTIDENGTAVESDVVKHNVAIYAMTLVATKGEIIESKRAEIEAKLNELPDFEAITPADKAILDEIGKLIEEYNALGGVAENEDFYGTYIYALEMLEGSNPAEINVDLTPYLNRDGVYSSDENWGGSSAAGYPGNFDYTAFISDKYITWVTPWTDGMTDNKLLSDGHTFKLKVVDTGNGANTTNVIFWNGGNNTSADWTNIDVHDGKYNSVEVLANTNRTTAGITHTLIVRLNYEDGSEILGTNGEYELNFFPNNPGGTVIQSKRFKNENLGTIRHLTIPAEYGRTLESIDILNSLYTIDENGEAVLSSKVKHNAVIYAMTLVGTKTSVEEVNKGYIAEIEAKIDTLTNSAADYDIMAEIAEMLVAAADRGISNEDISNISKYNAEYPYFAKVKDVTVTNDNKKADVIFTFDREITDDMFENAAFSIVSNGETLEASKLSETEVKVSFNHGMEYNAEWGISVKMGFATDYNQLVTLTEPASIENVLFYEGDLVIENFYKSTNGTFAVKADVNTYSAEKVMLALYNGETLNTVKSASIADGKLSCEFTVADEMDESWTLKAFVWDSVTGMIPQSKAKVLNKTYGYDNFNDLTKNLTVVYFGDSQTEGGMFTTPLTNVLAAQREDTGATVTAVNAGQGGTAIDLGIYRLDNEVIVHNPDVVFVEFFPNDANISARGETTAAALAKDAQLVAYHENVIKRLLSLDHVPVIIYMNPMKEPDSNGVVYNHYALNAIDELLSYYGIPVMDFQVEAERLIATGNYTWDNFRISGNNVHFTEEGGQTCAAWMYRLMTDSATKDSYVKTAKLGLTDYQTVQYEHPQMISSKYGAYDDKWEITSLATVTEGYENPVPGDAFPNEYMAATEVGAEMTFKFKGTSLYIYTLIGAYGGKAEFEIDGIYTGTIDTYSTNSKSMYKSAKTVKTGLEDTEHTVTIRVIEANSNVKSEKAYFGIGKFMVEKN